MRISFVFCVRLCAHLSKYREENFILEYFLLSWHVKLRRPHLKILMLATQEDIDYVNRTAISMVYVT